MSDEQYSAPEQTPYWTKKRIGLAVVAAALVLAAGLFQVAAGKVRQAAEASLLAQANAAVHGRITAEKIDLSLLGKVEIRQVQVFDATGNQLAKSERVLLSYQWRDLLNGQLGPQLVTGVTVEKPEIWLDYQLERLNWDGVLKERTAGASGFHGVVEVKDGQLHIRTPFLAKTLTQVAGAVDCRSADQTGVALDGKLAQAPVKLSGQWGTAAGARLALSATGLDLLQLGLTAGDDPLQIAAGKLDELTVQLGKDAAGALALQVFAGRFSAVQTAGAVVLTQGRGQFNKQGEAILFQDVQARYKDQPVNASGQVLAGKNGQQTMQFALDLPAGDPAALLPGAPATGPLAVRATLAGPVLAPVLAGSFSLAGLQFGDLAVSGIAGEFSYAGQTLNLLGATGGMAGGTVSAAGELYPDTGGYALSVSGRALDSTQLTKKEVRGPLSLTGLAVGDAAAAVVQGSFQISGGKAYGVSFRTLSGNFVKRGAAEAEVSNLALQTELGVFYPEQLSAEVLEQLETRKLPVTKEALKETVTNKVLQKIFR